MAGLGRQQLTDSVPLALPAYAPGWRNDPENLPEMFKSVSFGSTDLPTSAQAHNLVDPSTLTGIIWSHAHIDHYGATDRFPPSIPVFLGAGSLKWINGGDKKGGLKSFPSAYLEQGREFIEVGEGSGERWKKRAIGPFEEAYDLFGDESTFLVKAPGVSTALSGLRGRPCF